MPQIIPAVVAAIAYVGTATTAVLTATATLAQIATVAAVGIGAGVGGMAAAKALTPEIGSQGAAVQWIADPDEPLRFAFGRIGVKGGIKDAGIYGADRMYVSFACTVSAAGPIKRFVTFRAGDYIMSFDGAGNALNEPYRGEMWLSTRLGAQPDTALSLPTGLKNGAAFPGWNSSRKMSGSAAYLVTLGENSKRSAYEGKIPAFVTVIEGLFCYDPRLDDTYPGGMGPCRLNDPSTWVWTQNPILFALKWALGLWEGPTGKGAPQVDYQVGGIGAKVESIRLSTAVEAANIADANGWISAAWPSTDDDKAQVLDGFLKAGGARYAEIAGQMAFIHRAAPRAPVFTVRARDTAGPIEIDTASSKLNRINTVRPRYWSEAHEWEMTALPEVTATEWQTEDGQGVPVKRTRGADYTFVPAPKQARELASLEISNSREGIKGRVPLRPYMDPEPGNTFIFDEPDFALSNVKCFVLDVEDDTENDTVVVTFETETDGKYPYAYGQTPSPPPAQELSPVDPTIVSPPLPDDWVIVVRPPATDGTQLPGFDLTGVVSNATADAMLISWRAVAEGEDPDVQPLFTDEEGEILPGWTDAGVYPPTTRTLTIQGPQSGAVIWIAIRYKRGNNYSDAILTGPLTAGTMAAGVVTDTTPPADVAGLTLSSTSTPDAAGNPYVRIIATWTANTDEDLNGYEVEITEGSVTVVDYVATNQHSREALTGRTYTFRVRAIDKAGNRSAWTAPQDIVGAGDTTPPGPPTTLEATASVGSIFLRWTNPGASDLGKVEVWENTTNNSGTATKIAVVVGQPSGAGSYSRSGLPSGVTRYYWLKAVDTSGNASGFSSGISATTASIQVTDFASNISAPELMTTVQRLAATPTLGRIVFDTTDGKLYRGTGTAWDRSTDGADITADSITAGQIAAGAISTTELAAGAVTAGKIGAGQVTTTELAAGAVNADKIQAGSITGDRISTSTSLPGTITVGSTGVSIGTIQSQADDPAARVNANSTLITPGRVQIQGGTSLDNWRDGTDINGGSIKTNSIQARSLVLAMRNVQSINNTFRAYPDTNVVGWTGGGIVYQNDSGTTTGLSLSSGSASYSGTTLFIYWSAGSTFLSTTTSQSVANGPNNVIMATYNGGALLTVYNGRTLITPEGIVTPSLSAISADLGSITAGFLRSPTDSYILNLAAGTERALFAGGVAYRGELIGLSSEGIYLWVGPSSIARADARKSNGWLGLSMNTTGGPRFFGTDAPAGAGFHAQANATVRVGTRTSAGSVTTSTVTITTTGASGSVSYAWSQISGDDTWSITASSGPITAFNTSVSTPGEQKRATFACLVTDAGSGRAFTIIVAAAAIYNV